MILAPLAAILTLAGGPPPVRAHDVHVSQARLVIEGTAVALRVECYRHDLERGLRAFVADTGFHLTAADRAERVFERYLAETFRLEAEGAGVSLSVRASGVKADAAAEEIVWYLLEGTIPEPPRRLVLLDGILFEQFHDQQNEVHLFHQPGDQRRTLYFTARDPRRQTVQF